MKTRVDLAPRVNCTFGAPMGRGSRRPHALIYAGMQQIPVKFYLQDAGLNSGGYDRGGAYWGTGLRVYLTQSYDDEVFLAFRASNRAEAIMLLRKEFPLAVVRGG